MALQESLISFGNNWGQININFQSKGVKPKGANKWGQININLVNEWDKLGRGASSYWSTRNRSAPLPNLSHPLEINVDLTPFIVSPLRLYPLGLEVNVDLTPIIFSIEEDLLAEVSA
jgi:hypothetical protein